MNLNQKGRVAKWIESHRDSASDAFLPSQRCSDVASDAGGIYLLRLCRIDNTGKVQTAPNEEDHFEVGLPRWLSSEGRKLSQS